MTTLTRRKFMLATLGSILSSFIWGQKDEKMDDHIETGPTLRFDRTGKFKILEVSDLHIGGTKKETDEIFRFFLSVADKEKPDLIVFAGDIVTNPPVRGCWTDLFEQMTRNKYPFALVFGNHDAEGELSREEILELACRSPFNKTNDAVPGLSGVGNYCLSVKTADSNQNAAMLYFFDSGDYYQLDGKKSYGFIQQDQIDWYVDKSKRMNKGRSEPLPSIAFFHIPLQEFKEAGEEAETILYGTRGGRYNVQALNTGVLAAAKECKDLMGFFVGHDHDNDYVAYHHQMLLAYGRCGGGSSADCHLPMGVRVIVLTQGKRTIQTWIRTNAGIEQVVNYPNSFWHKN